MFSITPSHIIQYLYCPRFTYFEYVLQIPQYEDKHYKVLRGRDVHLQKSRQNTEYLRRRLGVQAKHLDQYLTVEGLRGQVDEVLQLAEGIWAPLDYKFAQYQDRVYDTYKTQLYCYAWLIEENFGGEVHRGYLVYTRSQNQLVEVAIGAAEKQKVKKAMAEIQEIIENNIFPKATRSKKRCLNCTYRNICVQ